MEESRIVKYIGEQTWIDTIADPVQGAVRSVLDRAPGLADFLHGTWFGHPLHAAIVALPAGAFSTALVLDIAGLAGNRRLARAADVTIAIGLVGAGMAIAPGLADWSRTKSVTKRVGFVHATLNVVGASLYAGSLAARAAKQRKVGVALAMAGFGVLGLTAWLGGELAYRLNVPIGPEKRPEQPRQPGSEERVGEARMGAP